MPRAVDAHPPRRAARPCGEPRWSRQNVAAAIHLYHHRSIPHPNVALPIHRNPKRRVRAANRVSIRTGPHCTIAAVELHHVGRSRHPHVARRINRQAVRLRQSAATVAACGGKQRALAAQLRQAVRAARGHIRQPYVPGRIDCHRVGRRQSGRRIGDRYGPVVRRSAQRRLKRRCGGRQTIQRCNIRKRIVCDVDGGARRIHGHTSSRSTRQRIVKQGVARRRICRPRNRPIRVDARRQHVRQRVYRRLRYRPIPRRSRRQRRTRRQRLQVCRGCKRICNPYLRQRAPRTRHMRCIHRESGQRIRRRNRRHLVHRNKRATGKLPAIAQRRHQPRRRVRPRARISTQPIQIHLRSRRARVISGNGKASIRPAQHIPAHPIGVTRGRRIQQRSGRAPIAIHIRSQQVDMHVVDRLLPAMHHAMDRTTRLMCRIRSHTHRATREHTGKTQGQPTPRP